MKKIAFALTSLIILFTICIFIAPAPFLRPLAWFLIADEPPEHADAVVVLNTGLGIYERLMEAASLYKQGYVDNVVINGNRKNGALKKLETMGLQTCCSWDEDHKRILELFGVPRSVIISISAENAYDTVSEAQAVGKVLQHLGMKKLIITTSKTHTSRAIHIWRDLYGDRFQLISVAAKNDPFPPDSWWSSGNYCKKILYEYGSWLYFFLTKISTGNNIQSK